MALITRISRLFKADFHAVLDQIEEPEMLLRQAIREMEDELANTGQQIRNSTQDCERLTTRQTELANSLGQIDEELDVCFESGEEELARDLIKRKLETERLAKRVDTKLGAGTKALAEQQKLLDENRATLESMRQKAELFSERSASHANGQSPVDDIAWSPRELGVSENDVEVAFLREKKRRAES